eukprot:Gregarina_sp_Poly_1__6019@NODE_3173_length_1310_cov_7_927595_g2016_i0_p2_GENE_NODE_3173_length_1310_cov_7_927595_g2016_i0NODE_3173_length_1310_cov_7_927595_g2016_i0_p2_ORF_typecomplete_len123_score13_55DUF1360/PF07098_11/0_078DUF4596/PF15363_6/0_36_NODE_3173_length_1310_cov_7_927595_g2016_i0368736
MSIVPAYKHLAKWTADFRATAGYKQLSLEHSIIISRESARISEMKKAVDLRITRSSFLSLLVSCPFCFSVVCMASKISQSSPTMATTTMPSVSSERCRSGNETPAAPWRPYIRNKQLKFIRR